MLLKFLLDRAQMERHPGYAFIAIALVTHLRTIRALELTLEVWKAGLSSLVKAEDAKKQHIVRKIEELLRAMVREAPNDVKPLLDYLKVFAEGGRSVAVKGLEQMISEMGDAAILGQGADVAADAASDDIPVLAALDHSQRPELTQAVEAMFAGAATCEATADLLLKRMSEVGGNELGLVSCVVRASVHASLREGRGPAPARYLPALACATIVCRGRGNTCECVDMVASFAPFPNLTSMPWICRFGQNPGLAISQCVALISVLEARRNSKEELAKMALHIVIRSILEPEPAAAAGSDGTTPNSMVDTPQPQTPFSPATPDSLPVVKKACAADDEAATAALRQDAALAVVGTLLARGLLLWEFVQSRFKMEIKKFNAKDWEKRHVLPVLNFVEMLLTEKRRAAGAMMTQVDWQRLKYMRRIQDPAETYQLLISVVQMCEVVKHQNSVVQSMQQVMQDGAMCSIAASDDPANFYKDLVKVSHSLLKCWNAEFVKVSSLSPPVHAARPLGSGAIAPLHSMLCRFQHRR